MTPEEWAKTLDTAGLPVETVDWKARAERAEADLKVAQVWHEKAQDFLRQMREAEARAERAEVALREIIELYSNDMEEGTALEAAMETVARAALEAKP